MLYLKMGPVTPLRKGRCGRKNVITTKDDRCLLPETEINPKKQFRSFRKFEFDCSQHFIICSSPTFISWKEKIAHKETIFDQKHEIKRHHRAKSMKTGLQKI